MIIPPVIVALSVLLAYDRRGNPSGFLPNAGGLILSAVALGFIVFVASWSASRPSRACPECGGRIPLLVVSRSVRIVVKPFRENRNPGESFLSGRLEGH